MTRRNPSSDGSSILLLLAAAGAAYLWYTANYSTTSTTGTAANPITVPGAPAPVLVASGPLTSAPVGPGVSGYFDATGQW